MGEDGDDAPAYVKLSAEEKAIKKQRQQAMSAFQRAVTMMAFTHLSGDDEKLFTELLKVLSTEPADRTEWELQRLLLWAEHVKTSSGSVGFPFILQLPGPEESDVRIEVCRCMTVERIKSGHTIMKQGDKGECMYIIMRGEVEVLAEENGSEKHLAFVGTGASFGDVAIMADDEADQIRTATVRASQNCVLGVLSRDDYRRHIVRLQQEAKAEVVEMMQNVPYLSRVSRGDLLRMAMMFKPVTFYRGDIIAAQGEVPEAVTFVTSGNFVVTTTVEDEETGKKLNVEVLQTTIGSTIEPVGLQLISDDQRSDHRCTLRAATTCEAWAVGRNVAKRVLNKRHVLQGFQEHTETIKKLIQKRVAEQKAGDAVRSSLGFTPRKAPTMIEKAVGSRRVPHSADTLSASKRRTPPPPGKDYRRASVYVPEAKDQQADEQQKLMAMANYARHHPHREPLHLAKTPRE
jgi:CRP-like cAMP-binding protein